MKPARTYRPFWKYWRVGQLSDSSQRIVSSSPGAGAIVLKLTHEMCTSSSSPARPRHGARGRSRGPGVAPRPEIGGDPSGANRRTLLGGRLREQVCVVDTRLESEAEDLVEPGEARAVHQQVGACEQSQAGGTVAQVDPGRGRRPSDLSRQRLGPGRVEIGDHQLVDLRSGREIARDRCSRPPRLLPARRSSWPRDSALPAFPAPD